MKRGKQKKTKKPHKNQPNTLRISKADWETLIHRRIVWLLRRLNGSKPVASECAFTNLQCRHKGWGVCVSNWVANQNSFGAISTWFLSPCSSDLLNLLVSVYKTPSALTLSTIQVRNKPILPVCWHIEIFWMPSHYPRCHHEITALKPGAIDRHGNFGHSSAGGC